MTEPTVTVDQVVARYIQIRDDLKTMDERHKAERAPLVETQNLLTEWIMKHLETTGSTAVKTNHGTCYQSTRYTASLADADAFMKFVTENQMFDLLDRRANSTAVRDYVEEHKSLPPGCNLSAIRTIGVRRV
jgi:hypothetical protein